MTEHPADRSQSEVLDGPPHDHVVRFYDDSGDLVRSTSAFLAGALLAGAPALVISVGIRLPLFGDTLASMGVDLDAAQRTRQLQLLDSRATLESFMQGALPDARLFQQSVGSIVASTVEIWRPRRLRAYGDMVDLLWLDGNTEGALALEALWNELAARQGFALHCAYDARHFRGDDRRAAFDAVCGQHGGIIAEGPQPAGH